jgi:hypothetical protein
MNIDRIIPNDFQLSDKNLIMKDGLNHIGYTGKPTFLKPKGAAYFVKTDDNDFLFILSRVDIKFNLKIKNTKIEKNHSFLWGFIKWKTTKSSYNYQKYIELFDKQIIDYKLTFINNEPCFVYRLSMYAKIDENDIVILKPSAFAKERDSLAKDVNIAKHKLLQKKIKINEEKRT